MKQWLNPERTILVMQLDDGTITVAVRPDVDAVWGPPNRVEPDRTLDDWRRTFEDWE